MPDGLVVARAEGGVGGVGAPLAGLGTRGAGGGGRGVGGDRSVLGGAKDGKFAGQAVDLRGTVLVSCGWWCVRWTYHCLLLLLELQVKIGGGQRTRVPQGAGTGAHAGVIADRGS